MVTVYSKVPCPQCTATKRVPDSMAIEYREARVDLDEDALAAVKALGYQQAPVVYVDAENHWSGLDPTRLASLAS